MLKTASTFPDPDLASFWRQVLRAYDPSLGVDCYVNVRQLEGYIADWTSSSPSAASREALARAFFTGLKQSFVEVKKCLMEFDTRAEHQLKELSAASRVSLENPEGIERVKTLRVELQRIIDYRKLNCEAFRYVLERFLLTCATDSLELQHKVRTCDSLIASSTLQTPVFDCAAAVEYVTSCFAILTKKSFEEATEALSQHLASQLDLQPRIMPTADAFFFQPKASHRLKQGCFGVRLIAGRTNPALVRRVESIMQSRVLAKAHIGSFANGEVSIRIDEAVRGDDVFVVQSFSPRTSPSQPAVVTGSMSESIVELLLTVQAVTLASAARCTVVVPYMAYTKHKLECAALAEMFTQMGCQRVITVDMYKAQVEGFFACPVENLTFRHEFIRYLTTRLRAQGHDFRNLVIVSPDSEAVAQSRLFADSLMQHAGLHDAAQVVGVATAVRRLNSESIDIIGNVQGKTCFIVDSVIDEALNVTNVAIKLKQVGATSVTAIATHALLSGKAVERLSKCIELGEIFVSDSVEHDALLALPALARKLRVLPMAPLVAEAIDRIHNENTLSTLIDG